MTCIVAIVENGKVHMAGDKCGSDGYTKLLVDRPKIFLNGDFIIGYTSSFRMGQLLEFTWTPPEKLSSQSEEVYIYKTIINSIKDTMSQDGYGSDTEGGTFLFGYNGSLYQMQNDYSIFKLKDSGAVGCGEAEAKGVLFALNEIGYEGSVEYKLGLAIRASSRTKAGVSPDYDYLVLE